MPRVDMLDLTFPASTARKPVRREMPVAFALTLAELVKIILEWLPSTGMIARASEVCTVWYRVAHDILKRLHNIDVALSVFVDDVPELRRVMCEMDGVIGGAFAVNFFQPYAGNCSSAVAPQIRVLELYFEWAFIDRICGAMDRLGCVATVPARSVGEGLPGSSYWTIRSFSRRDTRIDIVFTMEVALYCVLMSDSAATMNFITWDNAYCLFPRDLLLYQRAIVWNRHPDALRTLSTDLDYLGIAACDWEKSTVGPRRKRRWIGDSACWTVELNTDTVKSDDPSPYVWDVNNFLIDYESYPLDSTGGNEKLWRPIRICAPLRGPMLLYKYAVADDFVRMFYDRIARKDQDDVPDLDDDLEDLVQERILLDK